MLSFDLIINKPMRRCMLLLVPVAVMMGQSCERTLETEPLERITDGIIWDPKDSAGVYAQYVLNDLYSYLPMGFNRINGDLLDAASDDAISSQVSRSAVEQIATGGITPFSNPDDAWEKGYKAIRKATLYLNNIDIVPIKDKLPDGRPARPAYKAEARFLRALAYFELLRRYGGVPLMGDQVRELDDDVQIPRSSFEQCVQYIVHECDAAADSLRPDPVDAPNLGRVTRTAALALKARVLLCTASPLYNGGNTGNELTGYTSYNPQRWQQAAEAARDIIDTEGYQYKLQSNFRDLFLKLRNDEAILTRTASGPNITVEETNGPVGYASALGYGRTSPTQELVNAFGMINGKPVTDPLYNPADPYSNRDPRLSATILYNGAKWLNTSIETFEGGRSKPGGVLQQTKTAYYLRKFMGNFETTSNYANTNHDFVLFRYAEVLLNFAEAWNEFAGPSPEVYQIMTDIRKRAGITAGADSLYGLTAGMSKEAMREVVRNERRVELAFEEHRFWDIRRWKIAAEVYNKPLHGMRIVKSSLGSYIYSSVPVLNTAFDPAKMYFYPVPYAEVAKNAQMRQNPGW